jgi:hypothetical protein
VRSVLGEPVLNRRESIMRDVVAAGSARRRAFSVFGPGVFALSLTLVDQHQRHAVAANTTDKCQDQTLATHLTR